MTTIKIDDEIGYWGINAKDINKQLMEAMGDITVEISSPGGSVYEGIAIFNAIKAYNKGTVTTVITSLAASMASVIALAGDKIKAYDNSVYMIHNAMMFAGGDAREFRKNADHLESITNLLAKNYVNKTSKSKEEIKKLMDDETYFYGIEILENGFIDEIIESNSEDDSATAKVLASESVKNCLTNYKQKINNEESEQIAALLTDDLGVNPASAKIENSTKGNSMEYTKEKFEALEAKNAEALSNASKEAIALERERVAEILALGAKAEFAQKAISEGMSVGNAAIELVAIQRTELSAKKTDFEEAAKDITSDEGESVDLTKEELALKEAQAALENYRKVK